MQLVWAALRANFIVAASFSIYIIHICLQSQSLPLHPPVQSLTLHPPTHAHNPRPTAQPTQLSFHLLARTARGGETAAVSVSKFMSHAPN